MDKPALDALLYWFPAFLFSTTVHEAAHAWAALRLGDPTAYLGGQVSLNPLPHIRRSPVGMLVIPLLTSITQGWTMGWAAAPYDPVWAHHYPRRAAWMAAAGPAGNLLIALVAWGLLRTGLAAHVFAPPDTVSFSRLVDAQGGLGNGAGVAAFAGKLLSILLVLNTILFTFNLLPLPPLDGSVVITLPLPDSAARSFRALTSSSVASLLGILVAWKVFPWLVAPMFRLLVATLYPAQFEF
jgi:Zn-dependent protease